jgi:hypothetical protein
LSLFWGTFSYKSVIELKPSWLRASIKAWSHALNGGFKHHHCCIHITSCGIKIKSEKNDIYKCVETIDELHENLYLIEVMISYMVFLHNSLPILLCISCKKVLKEASNIVHNNIKWGGEGVCPLEGRWPS